MLNRSGCTALAVTVGLLVLMPSHARSQDGFLAWVGLYEPAQLGWLENENRIRELCPDAVDLDLARCFSDYLSPAISVHPLHREPDASSPPIGDLVVAAVPGRGLSAHFRPAGSRQAVPFEPDLYLQDWGYGPYFHQTFSAREGSWFQLPAGPWEGPVWLDREDDDSESFVIRVHPGDIIELEGEGLYVVAAEADALVLRPEQPADMWCDVGDPPPMVAAEPRRMPRVELTDSRGHLVFGLKYMKGC